MKLSFIFQFQLIPFAFTLILEDLLISFTLPVQYLKNWLILTYFIFSFINNWNELLYFCHFKLVITLLVISVIINLFLSLVNDTFSNLELFLLLLAVFLVTKK